MPLNFTLWNILRPSDQATVWSIRGSYCYSDLTCTGTQPVSYSVITGPSFPWIEPVKACGYPLITLRFRR